MAAREQRKLYLLPLCAAESVAAQACLQGRILTSRRSETRYKVPPIAAAPFPGQSFKGLTARAAHSKLLLWTQKQAQIENRECYLRWKELQRQGLLGPVNMQKQWQNSYHPDYMLDSEEHDYSDVCAICFNKTMAERGRHDKQRYLKPSSYQGLYFHKCSYCHASPSLHHGRCCPQAPQNLRLYSKDAHGNSKWHHRALEEEKTRNANYARIESDRWQQPQGTRDERS